MYETDLSNFTGGNTSAGHLVRGGEICAWDDAAGTDSGDLAMIFAGTYATGFYRALHHCLHDDLDLRRRDLGLSRAPHPQLSELGLDEHRERVATAWAALREREPSERNPNPTRLRIPVAAETVSITAASVEVTMNGNHA